MAIFYNLGKSIVPKKRRVHLGDYVLKAGVLEPPYDLLGLFFILSTIVNFVTYYLLVFEWLRQGNSAVFLAIGTILFLFIAQLLLIALILILFWVYFEIKIFRRTSEIEKVLPDFLEAVSVNLRAGMTFDKALWNSVESEYGILEKEIEIVAKKVMTGEDTEEALKEFAAKYNSPLLRESMDLITIGIRSGGQISDLIDRVVENVKTASYLKKELIANVMSYVIFIALVALIIAPALFALSYQLMLIIQSLGSKLSSSGAGFISFEFGSELIKKEDFINFSKASIAVISIASSAIIADLREGSIKGGVKYIFFFVLISFFIYEVMLKVFTGIFSALI
ncbi:type II secretion system F family protein [Candidatus Woesearchaeota archaeon]|nr:type II secretion system F family protein [Candidatus Woesearchaeota archaeon]